MLRQELSFFKYFDSFKFWEKKTAKLWIVFLIQHSSMISFSFVWIHCSTNEYRIELNFTEIGFSLILSRIFSDPKATRTILINFAFRTLLARFPIRPVRFFLSTITFENLSQNFIVEISLIFMSLKMNNFV